MQQRYRSYPQGTKVQHRNGYIKVKVENEEGEYTWLAESRRIWELKHGPLDPGDRIFHVNGDRTDNRIQNLSKVHFNQTKFVFLKESRVLYLPDGGIKAKPQVPKNNLSELRRNIKVRA